MQAETQGDKWLSANLGGKAGREDRAATWDGKPGAGSEATWGGKPEA